MFNVEIRNFKREFGVLLSQRINFDILNNLVLLNSALNLYSLLTDNIIHVHCKDTCASIIQRNDRCSLRELHNVHKDNMRQKADCCSLTEGGTCTDNWASPFKYLHLYSTWFLYTLWTVEIEQVEVYTGYGSYCGIKLCIDNLRFNEKFYYFPKIREKAIKFFIRCFTLCSFN